VYVSGDIVIRFSDAAVEQGLSGKWPSQKSGGSRHVVLHGAEALSNETAPLSRGGLLLRLTGSSRDGELSASDGSGKDSDSGGRHCCRW
jgi:hypothetical protein